MNTEIKGGNFNTFEFDILRPGGNDTALVKKKVSNSILRKQVNENILGRFRNVEQVGFVKLTPGSVELMMAGKEFCGNATRSTAYLALEGKPGDLKVQVSGVNRRLSAGVDEKGNAWAQMPINPDPGKIYVLKNDDIVVVMEGITQVLTHDINQVLTESERKMVAFDKLKNLGLTESVPAAGVIYFNQNKPFFEIKPVVWVRDIRTIFCETACGSGTAALGLAISKEEKKSIQIDVLQPSGMKITISVDFNKSKDRFENAIISGPVMHLANGCVDI
jgi:diaminopimelate epimerase